MTISMDVNADTWNIIKTTAEKKGTSASALLIYYITKWSIKKPIPELTRRQIVKINLYIPKDCPHVIYEINEICKQERLNYRELVDAALWAYDFTQEGK